MLSIGILSGLEFYLTYAQSWNFIWQMMPIGLLSGLEFYLTYSLSWNFIWVGILSDLCPELECYLINDVNWNFIWVGFLSDLWSQLEFYLTWNFLWPSGFPTVCSALWFSCRLFGLLVFQLSVWQYLDIGFALILTSPWFYDCPLSEFYGCLSLMVLRLSPLIWNNISDVCQ